ncbi:MULTISPECIES: hypothetical protein [unclassified Polaribacter]|jgi:hypothetical protein|uniref:hypothetical protein n=1 Tax=unclassified Polaribacter TaxID=196858 RepID=UPI001C501042|nr:MULTISPECIES: hypothetical protein [unclassified Polaribacter]QXP62018.1 hypothetical protein H0I27_08915 [Polaribacter sp. HaHaR_3_91]QXP67769.1 hypothetical protein H0I28_04490 [Polaribacter sp. AHE13PA]QXP69933.1 hypothetical protein H0I29_15110 [Polaribacter sp. R2A056_3_33]
MLAFRTEIRNSPREQTLKIYLSDTSFVVGLKNLLENIKGVRIVEVQESFSRNRVAENVTIYRKEKHSINALKEKVDTFLGIYFEKIIV